MAGSSQHGSLMSEINVTPFVDVMLVLLIIFMVTAPLMMQGVNVDLPQTSAQAMESEEDNLVITVNKDGEIFLNEYKTDVDALMDRLSRIYAVRPDQRVYLQADRTVPYGLVARVMADVKASGFSRLGVVTTPQEKGGKS
ncbi:MAG: protein TolR [Desulfatibacillaceae bacterium]|nr:protein TolR [Desulfatibacillaceae bacterium]